MIIRSSAGDNSTVLKTDDFFGGNEADSVIAKLPFLKWELQMITEKALAYIQHVLIHQNRELILDFDS